MRILDLIGGEPGALNEPVATFSSMVEALAAQVAGDLAPGQYWRLRAANGEPRISGHVNTSGSLIPHPLTGHQLTGVDLGVAGFWTQTEGAGGVVYDSNGVTATADSTNTVIELKLTGGALTVFRAMQWAATIRLTTVTSVASNFRATFGYKDPGAEPQDFCGMGWRHSTNWKQTFFTHNYNGGAPIDTDLSPGFSLDAEVGNPLVFRCSLGHQTNRGFFAGITTQADGTILAQTTGAATTANVLDMAGENVPTFRVEVPTGGAQVLVARLEGLGMPNQEFLRPPT